MKKTLLSLLILTLINLPINASAKDVFFDDVDSDSVYVEAIKYLVEKNIVHGREDNLFYPDNEITRAEALKIIYDLKGVYLQKTLPTNKTFPDVDNDKWYATYVYSAKRKNTVSGFSDGNFWPDRNISRAESCKIVLSTYNVKLDKIHESFSTLHDFSDIEKESWYSGCVGFSKFYDLFDFPEEDFNPDKKITRAEFSHFAYKTHLFDELGKLSKVSPVEERETEYLSSEVDLAEIPDEYKDSLELLTEGVASYYGDSFNGRGTASGATFDNSKFMAAHPLLPFNSFVRVTNTENNNYVDVEILDCGPFVRNRVIDLSKVAFEQISHLGSGLANVKIQVLKLGPKNFQDRCFDLTQARW